MSNPQILPNLAPENPTNKLVNTMKKVSLLSLLLAFWVGIGTVWADEPFRKHRYDLFKVLPPAEGSIVFVGNSITDMAPWVEMFRSDEATPLPIVNRGNSGTYSTEQSDNLESYLINKPKKLFMMIGTNDIATSGGLDFQPTQVLAYVKSIVQRVHKRSPETRVYLYSILNNNTSNRPAERWLETNRLVKAFVDKTNEGWLKYVDIYGLLSDVASGGVWSYDKLHLTAASYQKWTEALRERYLMDDGEFTAHSVLPYNSSELQLNGGLTGSHGMRATYFSVLPYKQTDNDILFFGDGEVKTGEWNELLGNDHIKNRGSGWGYGGLSLENARKIANAALSQVQYVEKEEARAVLIYAGTSDVLGTDDMETVQLNYIRLVEEIMANCPSARIYTIGLHPTNNATTNTTRIAPFNKFLSEWGPTQVTYIDCYTPFLDGNVANTKYIKNTNYLYGLGYVKMANIIKDRLVADMPDLTFNVISEEEAANRIAQADRRNAIGQALTAGHVIQTGEGMGQFGEAGMAAFNAKAEEAYTLLAQPSITETEAAEMASALRTAVAEALNQPTVSTEDDEHWYQFHSVRASDYYITAQGSATGVVGSNTTSMQAKSMWKFVDRNDGTGYDIVNRQYNAYLNPVCTYNTQIQTTTARPAKGWTLSYASTPGCYIVSSGEVQLNQTQAGLNYKIYNWSAESTLGQDRTDQGCQFYINEAPDIEVGETPTTIDYTISTTTGTLYNSNGSANQTYNKVWRSTAQPELTFTSNANNMNTNGTNLQLMSGQAGTATYTLAAPTGYVIDSYQVGIVNGSHSNSLTLTTDEGNQYTTSSTVQTHKVTNCAKQSVTFTLTGANGNGVVFQDFKVSIRTATAEDQPGLPKYSTEGNVHWYYIKNASTKAYCAGKVMYYDSEAHRMRFGEKTFSPDRIWSFWEVNGKLAIKNYNGKYIGTAGAGTGSSTQFDAVDTENAIYQIQESYGAFIIKDSGTELHAQEAGAVIVRWAAAADGASLWTFESVDTSHPEATLASTSVKQGKVTTGIGNKNQPIVRATLRVGGLTGSVPLQGISGRIVADNLSDVKAVKAYLATNANELFIDEDQKMTWREQNGRLFGQAATIGADGSFTITGSEDLGVGDHYLWIAYDISEQATEGNTVDAIVTGYTIGGTERAETAGDPQHKVTIFLSEGAALMPFDCGSQYYRIPAITTVKKTLPSGEVIDRLVVLTDDRLQHNGDLPNKLYIVAQYSDDMGRTWSRPQRVAGGADLGGDYGHGDASIVTDRTNGNIIGIMTCAGTYGHGFWASTAAQPQLWKTIMSSDGGETWTIPVDHTKSLYGVGSPNPTWKGGFSGSGAALQRRDGTLVSSFVNRDGSDVRNFHFFMSRDHGQTWSVVGTSGTTNADEPKTLERNNGDLSIFVRANGYNYHNVTSDEGKTWKYPAETRFTSGISGTACDGEYMVWCSTLDGNPWNVAFETLPNANSRMNVSICLSEDEGETFGTPRTICPWGSGYSTAVVLPDGTLGVYYEEDGCNATPWNYTLRFVRFSLNWASGGKFRFTDDQPFHPIAGGQTVGIAPTPTNPKASATYDLQGRRVTGRPTTGIYIRDGKKVWID